MNVKSDDFRAVEQLVNELFEGVAKPAGALKIAGRTVQNSLKKHFARRNQVTNKKGWKRQYFWQQIADSVQLATTDTSATVVVNDPRFLLKVFGGVVRPKRAKALAIPLKEEFYGVNPSTFPKDKFILVKSKQGQNLGLLAEKQPDGSLRLAYVLRKIATHKPDSNALPPLDDILAGVQKAVLDYRDREIQRIAKKRL